MLVLVAMLAGFVVMHSLISRPALRTPLVARLGSRRYLILHGVVSLLGMAAVFWAYFRAPHIELWPSSTILRTIPLLAMPVACILAVASVITPCAGLGGDRLPAGDNPAPGILGVTRHPAPWALILWSASHVIANGDLAGALLFGTFLAFAAAAPMLVDRRRRRLNGEVAWRRFAAVTSTVPLLAAWQGRTAVDWRGIGWTPVLLGLALFGVIVAVHVPIVGFLS
ncbi:MAG: NnrU protein [Rhodospirillales bacterium]|nr:MAG: NnrU protein [Rhodospirillales bacterium]